MTRTTGLHRAFATLLILVSLPLSFLLAGCESLYDGEEDCPVRYHVAFRFTNNILEADAFASQVKSVSLFVFDRQGGLVTAKSESGGRLARPGYTMTVDVKPGTYDLVAWCGLADGGTFVLNGGTTPATREEARTRLERERAADGTAVSAKALTPLFHAQAAAVDFPADTWGDTLVCTMDLTKDTNTIRIILSNYNAQPIDPDDFTFAIAEENGLLGCDNMPLADEAVTYTEWTKKSMDEPRQEDTRTVIDAISSMIAEIDMSRLMADRGTRLVIRAKGHDDPVLSLPLIQLLLYAKGEARSQMSDQRYLDCQDEYNLIFYINEDKGWYMDAGIYVNGWHMRWQSSDM